MMRLLVFTLTVMVTAVYAGCPSTAASTECRVGWTYFNGSCYSFGDVARIWVDAAAYCIVHGGYLVEVDSAEENNWLLTKIKSINFGSIWIGASEVLHRGTIVSAYSGKPLTFSDWSVTQPSDPPNVYEDCIEIRQPFGYKWNDFQCDQPNRYVCETSPLRN